MIKKYSEEKRQEVFKARQAGATITQIAIQTGIGCTTVKTWLKEAGFRSKHRWHPDEIKKIIKEYGECRSPKTIQEKYGICKSELYRLIQKVKADQRIVVKDYTAGQIAAIRRKLATLEEENQIFRKSGCGTASSIDDKVSAVKRLQGDFTVHAICRTLNLSKGTYYNRLYRSPKETVFEQRDKYLAPIIKKIFEESKERFGANMIYMYAPSEPHLDLRQTACYVLAQPRTRGGRHGTRRTRLLGGATVRILGQRLDDSRIQRTEGTSLRKYPPLDPSVAKGTPG